jgi:hypothetical protein
MRDGRWSYIQKYINICIVIVMQQRNIILRDTIKDAAKFISIIATKYWKCIYRGASLQFIHSNHNCDIEMQRTNHNKINLILILPETLGMQLLLFIRQRLPSYSHSSRNIDSVIEKSANNAIHWINYY